MEVSDYQVFDATNKINGFSPPNSSENVIFSIEIIMELFEIVVAAEYNFEEGGKQNKSLSWNFRTVNSLMHGTIYKSPIEKNSLNLEVFRCRP